MICQFVSLRSKRPNDIENKPQAASGKIARVRLIRRRWLRELFRAVSRYPLPKSVEAAAHGDFLITNDLFLAMSFFKVV